MNATRRRTPVAWRRFALPVGLVAGAALAGYLVTLLLVPAPLPGHVIVPPLRGLPQTEASELLTSIGLRFRLGDDIADPNVNAGLVAWQSPVAETQLPKGASVLVGLSSGTPAIVVPDLEDFDLAFATRVVAAAGLRIGRIDSADAPGDPGIVLSTTPEAGSPVRAGSEIAVTLSRGDMLVAVPSLLGLTIREARTHLTAAGLRAGQFTQRHEGRPGTVVAQSPEAGTMLPKGSRVDMTISGVTP